jgi:ABC-2 type transport system ATP-binding protein
VIYTGRSAYHHVLAMAQTHGIGRARVDEVIDVVGLAKVARKRVGNFGAHLAPWTGFVVFCGYTAVVIADAAIALHRRDV